MCFRHPEEQSDEGSRRNTICEKTHRNVGHTCPVFIYGKITPCVSAETREGTFAVDVQPEGAERQDHGSRIRRGQAFRGGHFRCP